MCGGSLEYRAWELLSFSVSFEASLDETSRVEEFSPADLIKEYRREI